MKLRSRIWWWLARKNICLLRGHRWTGAKFSDGLFHIHCYRCGHVLTDEDAKAGEPSNYKLPWGDTRKANGRLFEAK